MSRRPKKISRRATPTQLPEKRPANRWYRLAALAIVAVILGGALWWRGTRPMRLMNQAEAMLEDNPGRADSMLENSISLAGGNYPAAQVLRCRALGRLGQWEEALGCFATIVDPRLAPKDSLFKLGIEAKQAGQTELARYASLAVLAGDNQDRIQALQLLAEIAYETGRVVEARKFAEELLNDSPGNTTSITILARLDRESMRWNEAIQHYESLLNTSESAASDQTIRKELLATLIDSGQFAEAKRLRDTITQEELTAHMRLLSVRIDRELGRLDQAEATLKTLENDSQIDKSEFHFLKGLIAFDQGSFKDAVQHLQKVVDNDPYHDEAHLKLGTAFQQLNQLELAKKHLNRGKVLADAVARILSLQNEIQENGQSQAAIHEMANLYRFVGQSHIADRLEQTVAR